MNNFFTARKGLSEAIASMFRKNYPSFFPNLPFFQELAIGDFGVYEHGIFTKKGNIADFGVQYTQTAPRDLHTFFNCSSAHTSCQEASGNASDGIIPLKPSLSVKLERENAYFCSGVFANHTTILDSWRSMNRHIKFLKEHKAWEEDYRIISSIYTSRNFIFMATAGNAVQASAELSYSPIAPTSADHGLFSQAAVHYDITQKTNIGHMVCTGANTPQVTVCMQMLTLKRKDKLMNYKGLNSPINENIDLGEEETDYVLSIVEE
jgi:hypothetical protein